MATTDLFNQLKKQLELQISFLDDKPEETIDSTLRACWFTASGFPVSAEKASENTLPELTEKQVTLLNQLIERRLQNVPLAHITGRQNFMGVELLCDKRALIPRKETEILGGKALEISNILAQQKPLIRVMDICCGGGNLGLAIAHHNPNSIVFSTDLSDEAIALTKDNISFLNLNKRVKAEPGDVFSAFEKEEFYKNTDVIICNPPYISTAKVAKMNREISEYEPALAFDGGMFGTKIIQQVISQAPQFLTNAGWLLLEVGMGQGEFIMSLCERANSYFKVEAVTDKSGNIRVIAAQKNKGTTF